MSTSEPALRRARVVAVGAIQWIALVFGAALAAVLLWTERPYRLDLAAQFGAHLAVVSVAMSGAALALRRGRVSLFACASTLLAIALVARDYWPSLHVGSSRGDRTIRLVHYNAYGRPISAAFVAWLSSVDADIVCVVESPPSLFTRADSPFPGLTHMAPPGPSWRSGDSIYSRSAIELLKIAVDNDSMVRVVRVDLGEAGSALVMSHHPPSPRTPASWMASLRLTRRAAMAARVAMQTESLPMIVASDMNSTPHGRVHRLFSRVSGLRRFAPGLGAGTWPASMTPVVAAPIDRVWLSDALRAGHAFVGPRFESDHRPIVVDIVVGQPTDDR